MRPSHASSLLALILLSILSSPHKARAWTRAVVGSAHARVEVEPEATLSVLLRLHVEVHAGWLHELELVDLGPEVVLDRYHPPYFRSEDGEVFRPDAELHEDGRIRLTFPRREAPRRGEYRVFIRYRVRADVTRVETQGSPRARIVWSVPSWETGLHDVSVEFLAPKGSEVPPESRDTPPGMGYEVSEGPRRTIIRWRRIHLPRMTAWPLELDAPNDSIRVPKSEPATPTPPGFRPLPTRSERPLAWGMLLLAALVLAKRRSIERKLGRRSLYVQMSWTAVLLAVCVLGLAIQWFAPTEIAWGLPLLPLVAHRPRDTKPSEDSRSWQRAAATDLETRKPPDFLDLTTPWGTFAFACCGVVLFMVGQPASALLLLPVFALGTRFHTHPGAAETTNALRKFASNLRLAPDAPPMCFSWERASDDAARIRVHMPTTRTGLLTVAFVATSGGFGFVRKRRVMMLVQTRAQTDADDLLRRRTRCDVLRRDDGSNLRLVEWNEEAVELLRVLARKAPKPVRASRGTWILREISRPDRRAA